MTLTFSVSPDLAPITLKTRSQKVAAFGSNQDFQQPLTTFRDHNFRIVSLIVMHG
jgi:hypothetical protein